MYIGDAEKVLQMVKMGVKGYLLKDAEPHEFAVKNPPHGDAKSGEQIVKSIGCQGCHIVGEGSREAAGPRRTFGQQCA